MDERKITSLRSTFSVDGEVSDEDTRFLKVTIDLMNVGENYNGSYFSKEVVDENIDSIRNTPILGYIEYDRYTKENDFKGHEYVITRTEDGIERKYVGMAYGVIPEDCDPRWVTKTTDSGREVETLRVNGLMWERFSDATGIMRRDVEKAQSMELLVEATDGYDDPEDGLFHFTKFMFNGACILGSGKEPAMENANVRVTDDDFSVSDFVRSLQSELNDRFTAFARLIDDRVSQGGVSDMPKDIDVDEVMTDEADVSVATDFSDDSSNDDVKSDFANTMMQKFEDIASAVSSHATMVDEFWGEEVPRYYAVDLQDDEVIVVDRGDSYHYYGVPYTMDGDKPVLDFAGINRKKVRYERYEDGAPALSGAFDFGSHIASIEKAAHDKYDEVSSEYESVKTEYDEIKPKYDEYVAADEQRAQAEIDAAKDSKIAEYEDALSGNEDFERIKENKGDIAVDEIEKECAVLYVRKMRSAKTNFSKGPTPAVGIIADDDDVPSGYVHTKYGDIKRRY